MNLKPLQFADMQHFNVKNVSSFFLINRRWIPSVFRDNFALPWVLLQIKDEAQIV